MQHLECTADGGLVLATFDSYLLLIPSCSEDMGDAFREKIPRARRMAPRRLRLKPEDYSRVRKDSRFTKARFSQEEQLITAGLGELMVIWELLEVLKGNIYGYRLLDAEDHLRECQFLLSDPKKLIVVSDSRVRLQRFAK